MGKLIGKVLCKLGIHSVNNTYDEAPFIIRDCKHCNKGSINGSKWHTPEEWKVIQRDWGKN